MRFVMRDPILRPTNNHMVTSVFLSVRFPGLFLLHYEFEITLAH